MRLRLLLIAIASLLLVSPVTARQVWRLGPAGLELAMVPHAVLQIDEPVQSADLDGDGFMENLRISADGQAAILSNEKIRWHSPQAWQVRQALIADLNQDGQPEAVLLVWRPFKPWPVDAWLPKGGRITGFHNLNGLSCHLIMIGWFRNTFRERWAGSALAEPILAFAATDLRGSGKQALITLEGNYDDQPGTPASQLKVWEWNGFGFNVVSKVEGDFKRLSIAQTGTRQGFILIP